MSRSLFRSTSVVSAMTMISRVLGFLRDMIAAQIFGVGPAVDAFYVAFKIPNFMRGLFAEGSFSQAFVPVLSEYRQTRSHQEVQIFVNNMAGTLGSVLLIITILGLVFTPAITSIFAPGLDPLRYQLATEMLRITFPYLMLISLTAFSAAILNSYGQFAGPAFNPSLLNICLIFAAFCFTPFFAVPVEGQAWGVLLAGFLQLFFLLPFLYKLGLFPWPRFNWRDPGVRKVMRLMIPALFGASVGQISLLLNTIFASFLKVGSVTWLYYSDRLAYFPLGVVGVALATVVLPHLSRKHAEKSPAQFMAALDWGVRCNLLAGLPSALALWLCAGPIIITLFHYGKFNFYDVEMTRLSVVAYTLGLQAFMLVKVLSSGFYATQDIKTPVRIAIAVLVVNMILNAALIMPLAHVGLALATSISAWLNTGLLLIWLHRRGIYRFQPGWLKFLWQISLANLAMCVWFYWATPVMQQWQIWPWPQRMGYLTGILLVGMLIYFAVLAATGMRLRDFLNQRES